MAIGIEGSVGKGGENRPGDVRAVKNRLAELGFVFFALDDRIDPGLVTAVRLFQSIISGHNRLRGDGRVDVGGKTNRYLDASNAPRWTTMPLGGTGFDNFEARDTADQHDFGASWLAETIAGAGRDYAERFLATRPDASPIVVNDVSLPEGGDTPDHAGHETGLACDLRLPRRDGGSGGISNPNTNGAYDREAMRAQIHSLRAQPLVTRIFFNDNTLIGEGLCARLSGHNNHVHFEIGPPQPVP